LDNYAIKNNLLSREDLISLENLKKADPQAVVYADFAKTFKAANADATEDDIKANFRLAYNLDSDSPVLKAHGEALIRQQAESQVKALEGKYEQAKGAFDSETADRNQLPAFRKVIKSSLETYVPKQLTLVNDGDEKPVTMDIDPSMQAEVEKFIVDNTTFNDFKKMGDTPQMRELIKAKIDGYILVKNIDAIKKTVYEAGKAVGLKQGSTTGATEPFALRNNNPAVPVVSDKVTVEDDAKVASLFA
jgi:hypothetical protein